MSIYTVRWFHPKRGILMEKRYGGDRAFLEARLKYESLCSAIPEAQPRLVNMDGHIWLGNTWRTEEAAA